MSEHEPIPEAPDEGGFTYDVVVSLPHYAEKDLVMERAKTVLSMSDETCANLMQAISDHRMVKVKTDTPRDKADLAAKKFEEAGFRVEVTHTLKLKKLTQKGADGKMICPACETKVQPSPETQCPNCGVFINKLTEEFLERKRLLKKERERVEFALRDQKKIEESTRKLELERQIRAQIRAEMERKYGKQKGGGVLKNLPPFTLPVLAMLAIAGAFFGGRYLSTMDNGKTSNSGPNTVISNKDDAVQKVLKQSNQLQVDLAKMASKDAELLKEGIAVDPKDSLLASPGSPDAPPIDTSNLTPIIAPEAKQDVMSELVLFLAEAGQIERAREVIEKAITLAKISTNSKIALQMRVTQLEVDGWAIVHNSFKPPQEGIATLAKQLAALPDESERAVASARLAALLLHRPDIDLEAVTPLFNLAEESYKVQKGRSNDPRIGHELLIGRGRAILNHAQTRIAHGMRQKATVLLGQLDTLTRIAPDASAAVLHGYSQQLSQMMGNNELAKKNLEQALTKGRKSASLAQEGLTLRGIADTSGVYQDAALQSAIATLTADAEKRGGADQAAALLQIGLIHARNGNDNALKEVQKRMTEIVRPNAALAAFDERLRGLIEISLAWKANKANDPAAMENHLRLAAVMVN